MAKRKGVGPRQRFDIFKRDQFTCRYCGKRPPEVTLEVDHIIPVALAGENDDLNLITSCRECNSGKGCVSLASAPLSVADRLVERQVLSQQIEELDRFLRDERRIKNCAIDRVDEIFREEAGLELTPTGRRQVGMFLKRLAPAEVEDAAEITVNAEHVETHYKFRYFCGVCWRKIRGD